jgi:hypothetical protein
MPKSHEITARTIFIGLVPVSMPLWAAILVGWLFAQAPGLNGQQATQLMQIALFTIPLPGPAFVLFHRPTLGGGAIAALLYVLGLPVTLVVGWVTAVMNTPGFFL